MRLTNEKLKEEILHAGLKEFTEKGYAGASMRDIAASIGVTTGAIYKYYKDKSALFNALVCQAGDGLADEYGQAHENFEKMNFQGQLEDLGMKSDRQLWMIEYIYDNFDAFKLIVCQSAGTDYESYADRLIDVEVTSTKKMIDKLKSHGRQVEPMDDTLIHMIVTSFFNGMFETVRHDMKREDAVNHVSSMQEFYTAGWFKVLHLD